MGLWSAIVGIQTAVQLGQSVLSLFTPNEKKEAAKKLVEALPASSQQVTSRVINAVLSAKDDIPDDKKNPSPERPIVNYVRQDKDLYITFLEELLKKQKTIGSIHDKAPDAMVTPSQQLAPAVALAEMAGKVLSKHGQTEKLASILGKVSTDIVPVASAISGDIQAALTHDKKEKEKEKEGVDVDIVDTTTQTLVKHALGPAQPYTPKVQQQVDADPGLALSAVLKVLPSAEKNTSMLKAVEASAKAFARLGNGLGSIDLHCSANDNPKWGFKDIVKLHTSPDPNDPSKPWLMIGYHVYFGQDGARHQGRPFKMVGAHVKGHNRHSIGICVGGHYTFTKESMNAMVDFTKRLMQTFKIPVNRVYGHNHWDKGKECPVYDMTHVRLALSNPSYRYLEDVRFDKKYKCLEKGLYKVETQAVA